MLYHLFTWLEATYQPPGFQVFMNQKAGLQHDALAGHGSAAARTRIRRMPDHRPTRLSLRSSA